MLFLFMMELQCLHILSDPSPHFIFVFKSEDASKGISLGPILGKFNSLRANGKKDSVTVIEYHLLAPATNNFSESNVLGEGGSGRVYKARFSEHFLAAVKRLDRCGQDAEREFEVTFGLEFMMLSCLLGFVFPWDTELFFNLSIGIAEWGWLVEQNSAPEYCFPFGLLHSWWSSVSCLWNDAEWVFRSSITW